MNRKAPERCVICKALLEKDYKKGQYVCPNSPHVGENRKALLDYMKKGNFLEKAKDRKNSDS